MEISDKDKLSGQEGADPAAGDEKSVSEGSSGAPQSSESPESSGPSDVSAMPPASTQTEPPPDPEFPVPEGVEAVTAAAEKAQTGQEVSAADAGELLVERGIITQSQLDIVVTQHRRLLTQGERSSIADILVTNGFADRDVISEAMSELEQKTAGSEKSVVVTNTTKLRQALPHNMCRRMGIRPLKTVDRKLFVAATRSLTQAEKDELIIAARSAQIDIDDVIIDPRDKKETLAVLRTDNHVDQEALARKIDRLNNNPDEGVLIQQIINDMMIDAVQQRASDIHFDALEDPISSWISYRIDGDLKYIYLLNPDAGRRLGTRLKNDAGMDFSDTRRPQDGRFPFIYQGRQIDVRVASLPIDGGETITMRLLDPENLLTLDILFQDSPVLHKRMKALASIKNKTGGVVIISGATGSGKSTTLYAIIRELDRHRLNVMTVEDPVEYRIPFVRQAQVNKDVGASFADILRSQLRHDPDILVIGELRDGVTAETALHSAESGHFVLSTVHASDALQTIERLGGMFPAHYKQSGMFVLAHYLWAILNQRLLKRLCSQCKIKTTVADAEKQTDKYLTAFGLGQDEEIHLPSPQGCNNCGYTGYKGRVMLPEAMFVPFDADLRHRLADYLLEGSLGDVKKLDGIVFQSRVEAAAALLRRGVIDPEIALAGTDALETDSPETNTSSGFAISNKE